MQGRRRTGRLGLTAEPNGPAGWRRESASRGHGTLVDLVQEPLIECPIRGLVRSFGSGLAKCSAAAIVSPAQYRYTMPLSGSGVISAGPLRTARLSRGAGVSISSSGSGLERTMYADGAARSVTVPVLDFFALPRSLGPDCILL